MPRITGNSHLPSAAPQGNETPQGGNQGTPNARNRSMFGSLGAALGNLGGSRNRATQGAPTASHSPSPPRRAAPNASPSRPAPTRGQSNLTALQTLAWAGVEPHAFREAVGELITNGRPLPPDMKAALERQGVDTHVPMDGGAMVHPPLLALSLSVARELKSRPSIGTPHRANIAPASQPPSNGAPRRAGLARQNALSPERRQEYEAQYPQRGSLGGRRPAPAIAERPMGPVSRDDGQHRMQPMGERLNERRTPASGEGARASTSNAPTARPMLPKRSEATGSSSGATSAAQPAAPTPNLRRGRIAFESLEPHVQEAVLNRLDPAKQLGFNHNTVFYRTLDKSFLKQDKQGKFSIEGNPNSEAHVVNYLELKPKSPLDDKVYVSTLEPETLEKQRKDPGMRYTPTHPRASELPHPTLNVMYGPHAEAACNLYAGKNHVLVKIRWDDLRKAGGGQAFNDMSGARVAEGNRPLIVTLPAGKSVPVEIVR